MKALSARETQRLLRSKPPVPIGKLPLDPLGMTAMASIVRERLKKPAVAEPDGKG